MKRAVSDRLGLLLGGLLAVLPLLPSGLVYLGLPPAGYIEAGLLALLLLWLVSWRLHRDLEPAAKSDWTSFTATFYAWAAFLGLTADNNLASPVFVAHLLEAANRLFQPMNQVSDPLYSARVWIVYLEGFLAFAAVSYICNCSDNPRRRALVALRGWLTGFGLVSLVALLQYLTEFGLHPYWVRVNPNLVRSHATLDDPNALGSYLLVGVGLAFGVAYAGRVQRHHTDRWAASVVFVGILALGTTASRAAWGGFLLTGLSHVALAPARHLFPAPIAGRLRWAARALLAGLVAWIAFSAASPVQAPDAVRYRPTGPLDVIRLSLDPQVQIEDMMKGRIVQWETALQMARDYPASGVGLGRYPRLLPEYRGVDQRPENAHNFYLQVLAEMGIFGFASFGLLVAAATRSLWLAAQSPLLPSSRLALGRLLGTVAFFVTCITGHPLLLSSGWILWGTALAAVLVATDPRRQGTDVIPAVAAPGITAPGIEDAGSKSRASRADSRRWWLAAAAFVSSCSLVGYAVAVWRDPLPAEITTPWGYSWGLHPEEVDSDGRRFR